MVDEKAYLDFCAAKENPLERVGFDVMKRDFTAPILGMGFEHQADMVKWALRIGRALIAASFGLGKSVVQIEIAKQVHKRTDKSFMIICPLGVKHHFQHEDGPLMGVKIKYVTCDADIETADTPYLITNYERVRDGGISQGQIDKLGGVSLDEGAVLRALDSKTWNTFFKIFGDTEFRFVCTATPSPNNYIELLNYAVFLGKIDRGFALTRWFKRDSTKAGNLTLHSHHEEDFWLWVSTWGLFLYAPSDLGYPDGDYTLPKLNVIWHRISVDHRRAWKQKDNKGQHRLLLDAAGGISEATEEKRATLPARIMKANEIIEKQPDDHWLIWHHLEQERKVIQTEIPEATTVWGTMNLDKREQHILDFSHGKTKILATKPSIAGSGCNFQRHCNDVIFLGLDYKFHDFIQAVHRVYRFQQFEDVNLHMIYAESEDSVVRAMKRKWDQHNTLTKKMQMIIKKHGLNDKKLHNMMMKRKLGVIRQEQIGMKLYTAVNNDCVMEMNKLGDNHFDMIMTSIPFGNHYEYTEQEEDFGHSETNEDFFKQMDFLTPELLRTLKPGRICGVHVKDRILYGHQTPHGFMEVSPFSDDTVRHFRKHGFMYEGRRTLVKDVVAENNQTYRLGWTEMTKDATKMGSGLPEYVLLFRKPPTDSDNQRADLPVTKNKRHMYVCSACNHERGFFPGVDTAVADETLIKCPKCKQGAIFSYKRYDDGSTTGRWQIDAHQFWRSNGNALISQATDGIYDYDAHVKRLDDLDERGNLPKTYFVEPPQSHSEAVWSDIQYMHGLNGSQARRRVEQHICLAHNSMVLTEERGYVPIQLVGVGEHVFTHKGRWKPVMAVRSTGQRQAITVRAHGVPGLTLTPDHKLWCRTSTRIRKREGAEYASPDWVEADDALGSYVNLKLPEVRGNIVDAGIWWIVGRWIADGHWDARRGAHISCGYHEMDSLFEKLGVYMGGVYDTGTSAQVRILDSNRNIRNILGKCGFGASNKCLPPEAYTLSSELAAALLDGYLSGDGHFVGDRKRWMASSVSRTLLLGLAVLVQRVHGSIASVYAGRPARKANIQGREVNCKQDWILSFDIEPNQRRQKPFIMDDGAWKRVSSIEDAGIVETWNLRVADDESYTAEGCIVKNCPLPLDIVRRMIKLYSNKDDLILDPFAGLFTIPVVAMQEGRRGYGIELNPVSYKDGLHYCDLTERKAMVPSLFDLLERAESEVM